MFLELKSCKKAYNSETQRTIPPEETLLKVESLLPVAGITRVADITSLDRIGIPVFSSIRPMAKDGAISVYNGKGATPVEAKVSAMMEGIRERKGIIVITGGTDVIDPASVWYCRSASCQYKN